jgi:hypothetical protein
LTVLTLCLLMPACRGTGRVAAVSAPTAVAPAESVVLGRPAADIAWDGERLYLFETSGTRVIVLGPDLATLDTIPLTERVVPARGISADRYYLFVWDDHALYRLQKDRLTMSAWVNNLRVAGFAGYALGEALVSDADRGMVWHKMFFGDSRTFLDVGEIPRPGAMVALPDGQFGITSGGDRFVTFNRAGIVVSSVAVAEPVDALSVDTAGAVYLYRRGGESLLRLRGRRFDSFRLVGTTALTAAVAVAEGRLVVLDNSTRVRVYALPDR